ncbi:MAG TPA: TonB-dependent receptor [Burkholderiaceae bacterium]|nr:TonB-dependent receptor [Burkholderiaceae bacterium]
MKKCCAIGVRSPLRVAWGVMGPALLCAGAAAQEAQELEQVVVTAQKRQQNIQDVPIAITALGAEDLKDKGVTDIHTLGNLTPGVNLDAGAPFSGDSSVLSASIRGIGQDDFAFNLDPGVGVYLDGVYLARTIGANQNLLDVERVEILKGPQGTLFGRNTIGGAISIVTHTPGKEARVQAQATGGSFNRRDIGFTADLPISDTLLSSLTVSSLVRDGYQQHIPFPSTVPYVVDSPDAYPKGGTDTHDTSGGQNQQVIRGKLLWNAADDLSVLFTGDWQHQDQSAQPNTVLSASATPGNLFAFLYNTCISNTSAFLNTPNNPIDQIFHNPGFTNTTSGVCGPRAAGTGLAPGGAALGGAGYIGGPGGNLLLSPNPRIYWGPNTGMTGDIDTTYANGPNFAKNDAFGIATTVDWTLGPGLDLKSITGYRRIKWNVGIDLDGTPETIFEVSDEQHQFQFSQEFQLTGKAFADRLNWVGGLYYFKEMGYVHDFVPFEGILQIYDYQNDVNTRSYAGYLHADYKLTDRWSFTLGGRYSNERKLFTGGQADLNGFTYKISGCNPPSDLASAHIPGAPPIPCQALLGFPSAAQPLRYFPPGENEQTFNVFTPTLGAQFRIAEHDMAYVSYSKGFKSGGWTTRLSVPILNGSQAAFGPEYAKTLELGLKSELLQRRLRVNAAVYNTIYSGIQLNFQQGASPVLHNAGDARIKGAELETQARFGYGFGLNGSVGYIDAVYTDVAPAAQIPITSQLPKTPKWKVNLGPSYDFDLGSRGAALRFTSDFTFTSNLYNNALNTPELHRPATRNLDAAVHYLAPKGTYEVVLGGTNITNDRYVTTGTLNIPAGINAVGSYNPPPEWYLSVRATLGH